MKYQTALAFCGCACVGAALCAGCADEDDEPELPITSITYSGTLYVAPEDGIGGANMVWGLLGTTTGATSTTDGETNTAAAVAAQGNLGVEYATKVCSDLTSHGFADWYLPSREELNAMYEQRAAVGNLSTQWYWSSTETSADSVWLQHFADGFAHVQPKGLLARVRCVRCDP